MKYKDYFWQITILETKYSYNLTNVINVAEGSINFISWNHMLGFEMSPNQAVLVSES